MKSRTINRVNGGIAIYYGIGCAIAAFMSLIATGILLYQGLSAEGEFSWGLLTGLIFLTLLMGGLAYVILRTGYEQIDKK